MLNDRGTEKVELEKIINRGRIARAIKAPVNKKELSLEYASVL